MDSVVPPPNGSHRPPSLEQRVDRLERKVGDLGEGLVKDTADLHDDMLSLMRLVRNDQHKRGLQRTLDRELAADWNQTHSNSIYALRLWILLQPLALATVFVVARCV